MKGVGFYFLKNIISFVHSSVYIECEESHKKTGLWGCGRGYTLYVFRFICVNYWTLSILYAIIRLWIELLINSWDKVTTL